MGFLSVLGKIGKVAAPVAAGIFGGPAAAMATNAGVNALDKKLHGGSWKDAAISGAVGAGQGALGVGLGKIAGAAGGAIGKGVAPTGSKLSQLLKQVPQMAGQVGQEMQSGRGAPQGQPQMGNVATGIGPSNPMIMNYQDNAAKNLQMGRRNAIADQPFRRGYGVNTAQPNDAQGNAVPPVQTQMPPIYPNRGGFGGYNGGGFGDVGLGRNGGLMRGGGGYGMMRPMPQMGGGDQTTQPVGGGEIAPEEADKMQQLMRGLGPSMGMMRPQYMRSNQVQ